MYLHRQGQWVSFPCHAPSGALLTHYLSPFLHRDHVFSLSWPRDNHFHVAGAHRDLVVPSFSLHVPPAFAPYLDANAVIGPRATESPNCSTLQLCQTNQMWGGEPSELLMAKGY